MYSNLSVVRKNVLTAMFIALGVVLPMIFHMTPAALGGRALLPMHIPVLLTGLIIGPFYGFFGGLITPLVSSMTTGMPIAGVMAYSMMIELSIYGLVAGFLRLYVRTGREYVDLYISLIVAMLAGRIVAGLAQAWILFDGHYAVGLWVASYFTTSLPGIVLQLIVIPWIVNRLSGLLVIGNTS